MCSIVQLFDTNTYSPSGAGGPAKRWQGAERPAKRKEDAMMFAFALVLVLLLSSAYLFHQWYTGELQEPHP